MPDGLIGFKDSHNDQRDHQACILLFGWSHILSTARTLLNSILKFSMLELVAPRVTNRQGCSCCKLAGASIISTLEGIYIRIQLELNAALPALQNPDGR